MDLSEILDLMEQAVLEGDWSLVMQAKNMLDEYIIDRQYGGCEHEIDSE